MSHYPDDKPAFSDDEEPKQGRGIVQKVDKKQNINGTNPVAKFNNKNNNAWFKFPRFSTSSGNPESNR